MRIVVRRSAVTQTKIECEESLANEIDVGEVYAALYAAGETDLADMLTRNLGPQDARDLAGLLRRLIRKGGRRGAFRDYRAALCPQDASRLGLVAMWYERVGRANCRAWADLREGIGSATPALSLIAPAIPAKGEDTQLNPTDALTSEQGRTLMPDWLDAPENSVWSA